MKEKGYNPKRHRKGVVAERSQHTSQLYAPMKRLGTSFVNRHEVLAEKHVVINSSGIYIYFVSFCLFILNSPSPDCW